MCYFQNLNSDTDFLTAMTMSRNCYIVTLLGKKFFSESGRAKFQDYSSEFNWHLFSTFCFFYSISYLLLR